MMIKGLFLLLGWFLIGGSAFAAEHLNILYINADDLGVMDVGYNQSAYKTPHIDQLAKEGMNFLNAYAPSANCAPSRACVHSGLWSARHGVYTVKRSTRGKSEHRKLIPVENVWYLDEDFTTMAEVFQQNGYKTIHLGKYHINKDPLAEGYDVNVGGNERGGPGRKDGYYSPWNNEAMKDWSDRVPEGTHRLDIYVEETIRFMASHRDEPMFIHFSPYMVHTPIQAVPEYVDAYKDSGLNADYASMVQKLDEAIGRLMAALDVYNLAGTTLVVFCSDNGGIRAIGKQDPLRAGKGSYYEGGIREPMLMRWPGVIEAGSTNEALVNSLDFFPTFLAAAGIESDLKLDGVSLLPLMKGTESWEEVPQYWHFPVYLQAYNPKEDGGRDPLFRTRPGSAMRKGKWKLHEYFEDGALELYDLEADPGEQKNLAADLPEKTAELREMLKAWREETNGFIPTEMNPDYDAEVEAKAIAEVMKP